MTQRVVMWYNKDRDYIGITMSETKICSKCKKRKSFSEFNKNKSKKDGYHNWCKDCRKKYRQSHKKEIKEYKKKYYQDHIEEIKEYRESHKQEIKEYWQKYREEHMDSILEYSYDYYKNRWDKFPWEKTYWNIKGRCEYKSHSRYEYYGGRGIQCLISKDELKYLWFRDKAYLLEKPSIDRKNPDGNYELDNCRYIEMIDNIKRKRKLIVEK